MNLTIVDPVFFRPIFHKAQQPFPLFMAGYSDEDLQLMHTFMQRSVQLTEQATRDLQNKKA